MNFPEITTEETFIVDERFKVLDNVPVGVCVIDKDYRVLFWNRCLEDWTVVNREFILGTSLIDNFPCLDEAKYRMRIDSIFRHGPPVIFSARLHRNMFPSYMLNGELRSQNTIVTGIPSFEGDGCYALFAVEDVTELINRIARYRK